MPTLIGVAEPRIVVFDFGGTDTRVTLGSEHIDIDHALRYPTPDSYQGSIWSAAEAARVLLGGARPDGVGFGVAAEMTNGIPTRGGKLREYGWLGNNPAYDIATELNIDSAVVVGENDTYVAAEAERHARRPTESDVEAIYTHSTGLGGARFTKQEIIPGEPGHVFLKGNAHCACGGKGHIEAYVSGAGIKELYGIEAKDLPHEDSRWQTIQGDMADGVVALQEHYRELDGKVPNRLSFFGSIALKGPDMLASLSMDLKKRLGEEAPSVARAHYGNSSGLQGAYFMARRLLQAA